MSAPLSRLKDPVYEKIIDGLLYDCNFNYRNAILLATKHNHIGLVEKLVKLYRDLNVGRHTPEVLYGFALKQATDINNYSAVSRLLDLGAVSLTSCIRIASTKKYQAILRLLLSARNKRRKKRGTGSVFQQLIAMGEIDTILTSYRPPDVTFFTFEYKKFKPFGD